MIRLGAVYVLAGLLFAAVAAASAWDQTNPKRLRNSLFWGLLAVSFLFGGRLGDLGNGVLVLVLVASGGIGKLGKSSGGGTTPAERRQSATRHGNLLFLPALIIPATALAGTLVLKRIAIGGRPLIEAGQATLISLALGVAVALSAAMIWLRPPLSAPVQEGRRLLDSVGWAAILPQMLAALGAVFALAGVGNAVGHLLTVHIPLDNRFAVVATYTVGMALFTMIMGNAFAAFPVMTAAIGLPLLVHRFGGDPAIVAAIGMLSGFCGTLMTPMAANFNLVPVALLGIGDRNAVIKAQAPTALALLGVNTFLMAVLAFR